MLQEILAHKKAELAQCKRNCSLQEIITLAEHEAQPLNLAEAIAGGSAMLIAEIKKASPSRGIIREDFDPVAIAEIYARNRVAAISVLTESRYFLGSLDYLNSIRDALGKKRPPLIRKDFIFDPYQIYESRLYGADSVLLIAALATPPELEELINLCRFTHMEPLVEVHDEAELDDALVCGARIIGINNRDLCTLETDLSTTSRLRPHIPADRLVVSESGINSYQDIWSLRKLSVNAVLIGEALMSAPDINAKIRELYDAD